MKDYLEKGHPGRSGRVNFLLLLLILFLLAVIVFHLVLAPHIPTRFSILLSGGKITGTFYRLGNSGKVFYGPVALGLLLLALMGWGYDIRANALARRGLRYRHGLIVSFMTVLTNRKQFEQTLLRRYYETIVTQEELTTSFQTVIHGQNILCDDLAHFLHLRLSLRYQNKPLASFIFLGPSGTGKNRMAEAISRQLQRPFFMIDFPGISSVSENIDGIIRKEPQSVLALRCQLPLDTAQTASALLENLLPLWQSYGRKAQEVILILCLTTPAPITASVPQQMSQSMIEDYLLGCSLPPLLLSFIDRFFPFQPLKGLDLACAAAKGIEKTIAEYGLSVETGGLDPLILFQWMQQHNPEATYTSPEALRLAVEEKIGRDLVNAVRQKQPCIRLALENGRLAAHSGHFHDQCLHRAMLRD